MREQNRGQDLHQCQVLLVMDHLQVNEKGSISSPIKPSPCHYHKMEETHLEQVDQLDVILHPNSSTSNLESDPEKIKPP